LNAIDVLSKKGYTKSPVNITGTGATAEQALTAFKSIMVEYKRDYPGTVNTLTEFSRITGLIF
jgi:hypothetical protein